MSPITFKDVANLINRAPGTHINIDFPAHVEPEQFVVYPGSVTTSDISFNFEILYLYADVTRDGARLARTWINRKKDKSKIRVVHAPSVTLSIIEDMRDASIKCISLGDYFLSFMNRQIEEYLGKIKDLPHDNYIDPQIDTPVGIPRKFPNPVLGALTDSSEAKGLVAVLLGEPGQGKTHMSKFLAAELTKKRVIPVYVHSEQWWKMQVEDLSSIWKTIVSSFRYFNAPIGWAEGVEKEFVNVALKLGVFVLIFDGFDEFVHWNRGTIDPRESVQELINLAEETGTKLCITSRTSFWAAEISEADGEAELVGKDRLFEYTIQPFDVNHAANYFKKRFVGKEDLIISSSRLFELLKQDSSNDVMSFVGRGFFLSLVADLVSRGFSAERIGATDQTRLQWIMEALCQREQVRQKLPLDATSQLSVLREFATITARGEERNSETLRMVLGVNADLELSQIEELVKNPAKLKDHPLINFRKNSDTWLFTQDQIEYVLLAEQILDLCLDSQKNDQLALLLNDAEFTKALQTEVATTMVQQIFESKRTGALDFCKEIIAKMSSLYSPPQANDSATGCYQFAGRLALLAASRAYSKGTDRTERTGALLNLLPQGQLIGVQFVGTMSGLDLRDLTISNCHFDTVTFANCRFSSMTDFNNCRFTDLRVSNCEQFGQVTWSKSNRFDEQSRNLIEAELVTAGRKGYSAENLVADLDCLIRKFLPRETSGFKNIEERNLSRGLIAHSVHKNYIIDYFKRNFLDSRPVAGKALFSVIMGARPDFVFYLSNGMHTGKLAMLKDDLMRKLVQE